MEKIIVMIICCTTIIYAEKGENHLPLSLSGSFESQVELLIHRTRLPHSEIVKFSALQDDLLPVLRQRWSECRLSPVGPTIAGLAMTIGSEIDLHVHLPVDIDPPEALVLLAERSLKKFPRLFENIETFSNFSTPYLEVTHIPTQMKADLVFNRFVYEHDSFLLKYLFTLDHRVYPLMMVVRYLTEVHRVRVSREMTNMAWSALFVFFLQKINVLPPIFTLQKNKVPHYVDNWNVAFEENYQDLYLAENSDSMYKILGGFFEFYSKFDFENHVISPFTGMAYRREIFKDTASIPNVFENYKHNVENNITKPLYVESRLCMTGMLNHANNIVKMVSDDQAVKILNFIDNAAKLYRDVSESEFLGALLTMKIEEPGASEAEHVQKMLKN